MALYGTFWYLMALYETLWIFWELFKNFWKFLKFIELYEIHGILWRAADGARRVY